MKISKSRCPNEKALTRAVVESITHCTGYPPRRSQSIVPALLGWIAASLLTLVGIVQIIKVLNG